ASDYRAAVIVRHGTLDKPSGNQLEIRTDNSVAGDIERRAGHVERLLPVLLVDEARRGRRDPVLPGAEARNRVFSVIVCCRGFASAASSASVSAAAPTRIGLGRIRGLRRTGV